MKKNICPLFPAFETSFRVLATCSAICVLIASSGFAQTWTGLGGDDNWTTAANWTSLPVNDGTAVVVFTGSTRLAPLVDTAQNVKSVYFDNGASEFNLGGSQTLTITNGTTYFMRVNTTQTVSANLVLSGPNVNKWLDIYGNANVTFSGNINGGGGKIIPQGGSAGAAMGNVTISGILSNASFLWGYTGFSLARTVTFTGSNTYTGLTDIRGGTFQLGNGGATGSLSTSSTIVTTGGRLAINRNNAVAQGTDFSGSAITGTAAFIQAGSGTTTLNAANTYSGGTTVSAGTLLVNNTTGSGVGSGAVTVASGGTLGGSGSISGSVTVNSGGTLSPGNSPGLLTVGSLVLDSGSTTLMQLSTITTRGTTYDAVDVTSALTYGGALNIDLTGPATIGTYNLFDFASYSGTFSAINFLNVGATGTFDYATGELSLTAVPEPATWVLLAGCLTVLMVFRRRRHT